MSSTCSQCPRCGQLRRFSRLETGAGACTGPECVPRRPFMRATLAALPYSFVPQTGLVTDKLYVQLPLLYFSLPAPGTVTFMGRAAPAWTLQPLASTRAMKKFVLALVAAPCGPADAPIAADKILYNAPVGGNIPLSYMDSAPSKSLNAGNYALVAYMELVDLKPPSSGGQFMISSTVYPMLMM